jgi:hypothetical protein
MYKGDSNEAMAVSLVGRDGMTSFDMSFGAQISQFKMLVQASGSAVRLKPKIFAAEFHEREALRKVVLTYAQSLTLQIAQTAACARFHNIEGRLAQFLLMTRDRLVSDHFQMTQEMLSDLLGVRRVGVTNAAYRLKLRGLIDYRRGAIAIIDGAGLKAAACSCYGQLGTRLSVSRLR